MEEIGQVRFNWAALKDALKKKTMWFIFLQGFAGVFPWNVITFFFFGYLMLERGYDNTSVLLTMGPVVIILAAGYFVGGALGRLAVQTHTTKAASLSPVWVSSWGHLPFLCHENPCCR